MSRVLITAFEPYDVWEQNASWLTIVELTRDLPAEPRITTRLYPVDYEGMRRKLEEDLRGGYDVALHLGQAPGSAQLRLEMCALNVATDHALDEGRELLPGGPVGYRCRLPLARWANDLRQAGVPARVSYFAGTYLCNAVLYCSLHLAERERLRTESAFIHVPLDPAQIAGGARDLPSLPASMGARAIRILLARIAARGEPKSSEQAVE